MPALLLASQASNYKPHFHRTTAFVATIEDPDNDTDHQEAPSPEEADSSEAGPSQEDDDGLYIPSYLEEALPDNPTLQVKLAHAMQAHENETSRFYTCNQPGHLQKDHRKFEEKNGNRPLQPKRPPQNQSVQERVRPKPSQPSQATLLANPPK